VIGLMAGLGCEVQALDRIEAVLRGADLALALAMIAELRSACSESAKWRPRAYGWCRSTGTREKGPGFAHDDRSAIGRRGFAVRLWVQQC
jgi:hypothetical protein